MGVNKNCVSIIQLYKFIIIAYFITRLYFFLSTMGFITKFFGWLAALSKFAVYASSIIFGISGVILMTFSLYSFFNDKYILVFEILNFIPLSVFIYIFFPIGLILFIFGIWGCSAVLRESKFSLNVFFIINFGIFGTVLAGVVMTQIGFIPELKEVTEDYLNMNVSLNYDDNYGWKMDGYQEDGECCGLGSGETCFNWDYGVPDSCLCKAETENSTTNQTNCIILTDSCYNETTSSLNVPFSVYSTSCTNSLNDDLSQFITLFEVISKLVAIVCFVTVLFLIFVIFCGNCGRNKVTSR